MNMKMCPLGGQMELVCGAFAANNPPYPAPTDTTAAGHEISQVPTRHAQQRERVRRIGLLMGTADDREGQARVTALKQGLQELGWTDGGNIQIETRALLGPTPAVKGILSKAEAEQILRQAIETIKTGGAGDQAAKLLAIALEKISKFEPAPRQ
jgi:hypothetical protein